MPNNMRANIETGAQVLIAIAVLLIAGILVKRYLFTSQVSTENMQEEAQRLVGTRMSVPNVNWQENRMSLILFLKKDCVFCKASAPFYRQLIADGSQRNVKWIAILPESVEEGKAYLRSLELPIDNVQSASLSSYKIRGTPSALFVDSQGIIKSVWLGAPADRQTQMRAEFIALSDGKSATKQ